ncbi:hypothetical protein F2Q68_00019485 [Brassica cretica]|uniref:Uncharacterized protein n=1 Tax=Brassica cretica TaxID=69181 RepID=A0A8S9FP45_BRACR|nr:hypothetical protein F2Q68_00019485 [Brassica cretica]
MKSKEEEEEEEDGGGGEGQKGKSLIEKLRRRAVSVGHRRVFRPPSTPAHISFNPNNPSSSSKFASSSRKLAASLWEFYQYYDQDHEIPPLAKMHRAPYSSGGDPRAITPGSSLDLHGRRRAGEPNNNNLKTSTELLKVLNRIWSLEEQHSANISLIKSLKSELAHSRARIKELLRCQQADRREMDELVKQLAEEKLSKDTKERDRLSSAVQSLEEERKLRRRSESLQRKLARELSEVKSTLSHCVDEMERGSKSKKMLERLCDEFARGIKSYEREVHGLKQKMDKSWEGWGEEDQMVLCIAETWLDERIQSGEEGSVLEKLKLEIEAFLESKQKLSGNEISKNRRSSLESAPFHATSAPIQEVDSEEEEEEDSNCFELKKHGTVERRRSQSPSSLQVKFEDQMAWAMSNNEKKKKNKSRDIEADKGEKERNNAVGEMIRTHRRLLSETQGIDEGSCSYQPSRRAESPIRHWNPRAMTSDLTAQGVKDNTLKAKLSEARTKSSRPRIRLFKG